MSLPPETVTVQDAQLHAMWDGYLQSRLSEEVTRGALEWPSQQHLTLDFRAIQEADPRLADIVLARPAHALRLCRTTAWGLMAEHVADQSDAALVPKPRIGMRNLPDSCLTSPGRLRSDDLGTLLSVRGIVTACSETYLELLEGTFECLVCTSRAHVVQEDDGVRQEPVVCEACEKPTKWRLIEEESRFIDAQVVRLQQAASELQDGHSPSVLTVRLSRDLVMRAAPGTRVMITGIASLKFRRVNGKLSSEAERQLQAVHVEIDTDDAVDLQSTPDEIQRFRALAASPGIHERLARCIAPDVVGLNEVKLGVLHSLASSQDEVKPDGSRLRGRIHVLIAGDPGVAKSKLIGRIRRYVPRAIEVFGFDANRVGLSAGLVKDDVTGRWMMEPGALVLGHGRFVVLDELGLLDPEERPSLNSAMEDGIVRLTKITKAEYPAETTVIAAMNPVTHRFDPFSPMVEQLGLMPALRSRFDLVYCLRDVVDSDRDRHLATKLLAAPPKDVSERDHYGIDLSGDELRRYLQFALQVQPKMTPAAAQLLNDYYTQVRASDRDNPPFTPRQLDGLRRLAAASARLHLSDDIEAADARRAIELMAESLKSCGIMDTGGRIDGSLLQSGTSRAQAEKIRLVTQVVKDLQRDHPHGYNRGHAAESAILAACAGHQLPDDEVRKVLSELLRTGIVYQRAGGGTYAILT